MSWLLLANLAWALPDKDLQAELDRRVLLIDEAGRQIDCSLVEVQDERLVVRLLDGSLAQLPRDQVDRVIDLGPGLPAPAPIEQAPAVEEPEDDFGEAALEQPADDFDIESAIDDVLGIEAPQESSSEAPEVSPASEQLDLASTPQQEARVELPQETLELPETDALIVSASELEQALEPVEPIQDAAPEPASQEDWDEPAVASLGVSGTEDLPAVEQPSTKGPVNADLYYKGRTQGGALGRKTKDVRMAQNLGFVGGCCAGPVGCTATTMIFALKKPEVPPGDWQSEDAMYQQGFVQAYQETAQKEAAKRAFIAGTLGTVSTALVATVLVLQIY